MYTGRKELPDGKKKQTNKKQKQKHNKKHVIYSNANPQSCQYLTHANSHITGAVATMHSCFGLLGLNSMA